MYKQKKGINKNRERYGIRSSLGGKENSFTLM